MTDTQLTVTLPSLGEHVTEATITRWLVKPGDTVDAETPLLEVATDKVDTEVPSPRAGTVVTIHAAEDDVVEVGAPLVSIGAITEPEVPQRPHDSESHDDPVTIDGGGETAITEVPTSAESTPRSVVPQN